MYYIVLQHNLPAAAGSSTPPLYPLEPQPHPTSAHTRITHPHLGVQLGHLLARLEKDAVRLLHDVGLVHSRHLEGNVYVE